jgi:hypothetical protein
LGFAAVATELQLVEASGQDHLVYFYRRDDELVDRVGRYVRQAITSGAAAVVVATARHRQGVEVWLAAHGIDADTVRAGGLLYTVDAQETLNHFFRDGHADRRRFGEVIGGLIRQAGAGRRPVYVYGEMVALLWEASLVMATMALESLWNELGRELDFSLFCAYPAEVVEGQHDHQTLTDLCSLHSALMWAPPPLSGTHGGAVEQSRIFPHRADSPRAARHFVSETLQGWGVTGDVRDDAALTVTELTSNSLLHAHSDFMVTLALTAEAVYLSVQDHAAVLPTRRPVGELALSGRGLGMVAAVSQRWGADLLEDGKVVWAELRR